MASLREGEQRDDDNVHARRNAAQLAMAEDELDELKQSIDLRLVDFPVSVENGDLLERLYYDHDLECEQIATFVPEDVTPDEVFRQLRFKGVLNPWDDPHVLEACYEGLDMSTPEIAERICDNELTGETVRVRLHDFGILQEKSQSVLDRLNPEDLDLSPAVDDQDEKYLRRGSNGGASA